MSGVTSIGGDFPNTRAFLKRLQNGSHFSDLDRYGELGVAALSAATPTDTGRTSASWSYRIIKDKRHTGIAWYNTNDVAGTPLVILLQYGHGTGTGGYVQGKDFINPALKPVFDQIATDVWKKVTA